MAGQMEKGYGEEGRSWTWVGKHKGMQESLGTGWTGSWGCYWYKSCLDQSVCAFGKDVYTRLWHILVVCVRKP